MQYKDINDAITMLSILTRKLEDAYIENGGEVTPETEDIEADKKAIADLLEGDGVDTLGRWLKAKEDELATYKAEKAAADRRIKSVINTIDFIKEKVGEVLRATGKEKAKGSFYSFSQYESVKRGVDGDLFAKTFAGMVEKIETELPAYVRVTLSTTTAAIADYIKATGDDTPAGFVHEERRSTAKYTKPRAAKEEE